MLFYGRNHFLGRWWSVHAEGLPNFPLGVPSIIHCSKGQDASPFQHVWMISPEPRAPKAEMGFLNSLHAAHPVCYHHPQLLSSGHAWPLSERPGGNGAGIS